MRALIVVDLQNDFVDAGALAVPGGSEIIDLVNRLLPRFDLVVATQDWHPADHQSFASQHPGLTCGSQFLLHGIPQIAWPDHCVQGTRGADLVKALDQNLIAKVVRKGEDAQVDSYSGFFDNDHCHATGLEAFLREQGVEEVFVVGLATDYCVKFTALDAVKLGFKTNLIIDACRGVELNQGDIESAVSEMKRAGIAVRRSEEFLGHSTVNDFNSLTHQPAAHSPVELIAETKYLQLVKRGTWSFVRRPANVRVVCVVAVTEDRQLILVEQHRPPVNCPVIELPAGLAGDIMGQEDESLMRAAQRELLEETGFVANQWRELGAVTSSAGLTNEIVTMFLATGLHRQSSGGGDSSEDIQTVLIHIDKVASWLNEQRSLGKLVDARVFAGLYFANMK